MRGLSVTQMAGLRELRGHGNTMASLRRHRLVMWDGARWRRRIRGALILEGWTLDGLEMMHRDAERTRQERAVAYGGPS